MQHFLFQAALSKRACCRHTLALATSGLQVVSLSWAWKAGRRCPSRYKVLCQRQQPQNSLPNPQQDTVCSPFRGTSWRRSVSHFLDHQVVFFFNLCMEYICYTEFDTWSNAPPPWHCLSQSQSSILYNCGHYPVWWRVIKYLVPIPLQLELG